MLRLLLPLASCLSLIAGSPGAAAQSSAASATTDSWGTEAGPWRLGEALGTPPWFEVNGSLQARYESLDRRLRAGETGENHGFFSRLLLEVTARDTFLDVTAELLDSRIFGEPDDATPTTGQVNAVELLQGYVAARFADALAPGDRLRVQLGRHTMDIGSRRLAARNVFRNTINAFTGVNAQWESAGGATARAFYVLPVNRLPGNGAQDELRDNDVRFDEERTSVRFWGLVGETPKGPLGASLEGYLFGLDETDSTDLSTRNRDLTTVGFRWLKRPQAERLHWELESNYQFGESRSSAASNEALDHEAFMHHVTLGYSFPGSAGLRVDGLFDWVSGDNDPGDGNNQRFDSLFGVPRPEYGPTGLFRPVTRANLVSPGVRFSLRPGDRWRVMALFRANYLESDRDAWTTTGIQDADGTSGDHIGDLSEIRVRYEMIPDSSQLEFGVAYFSAGSFAQQASTGDAGRDTLFGYVQTTFWF